MVNEALVAAGNLNNKGVKARVVNVHTLRPLDIETVVKAARETKGIVVCEEHTVIGGLASSIQEVVAQNYPVKVASLGIKNRFGQSGEPAELLKEYGLTSPDIEKAVLGLIC
jgi:transketolase